MQESDKKAACGGESGLGEVMKERKIQEKLREKAYEEFLQELNDQEKKEIDELVSFRFEQEE